METAYELFGVAYGVPPPDVVLIGVRVLILVL